MTPLRFWMLLFFIGHFLGVVGSLVFLIVRSWYSKPGYITTNVHQFTHYMGIMSCTSWMLLSAFREKYLWWEHREIFFTFTSSCAKLKIQRASTSEFSKFLLFTHYIKYIHVMMEFFLNTTHNHLLTPSPANGMGRQLEKR